MGKKLAALLTALLTFLLLTGCGRRLTLTLTKASWEPGTYDAAVFSLALKLENGASAGIMRVSYDLICRDRDGNELYTFSTAS